MTQKCSVGCWALLEPWGDRFCWRGELTPALFRTRREALQYARESYGYVKTRKDLRGPPHNWRLPRAVRVIVTIEETT